MKRLYNKKLWASLTLFCLSTSSQAGYLQNFNEPNTAQFISALQNRSVHIVQLGDSHTAGDSLTDAMRHRLQQQLGDGGMGWAMPMYFNGQRLARFGYDNQAFQPISSRSNQQENYTLGGLIAKPLQNGSTLTLKAKRTNEVEQRIQMSVRQTGGQLVAQDATGKTFNIDIPQKNNQWQLVQFNAKLPVTLTAKNPQNMAIGGWWVFNAQNTGAVVSALGINGAELSHINRWNNQAWQNELGQIRPQLIILAYGTNEAYNNVNASHVKSVLTQKIQQIRNASPSSAILILSAPESLKSTTGQCGTRPNQLNDIQQVQKQVAQNEHTLYWDWQQAMGGSCSMKSWIQQSKASKDGVHFTAQGYTQLGDILANDLLALNQLTISHQLPPTLGENSLHQADVSDVPVIQKAPFNPNGLATICTEDENGKSVCNTTPAQNIY